VSHYLVIFDRRRGVASTVERYDDPDEAQARLFETETELRDDPDRGVILLFAESEASLRRTHGSLFLEFDDLIETARG
jgi:hypothetical protein